MKEKLINLLNNGFKPYRKIMDPITKTFIFKEQQGSVYTEFFAANFNVMMPGGTAIWLIKDSERYYFGLDVVGESPILIKE